MVGRGENAEIVSFVGKTVNSELSGNMIDLCPVGALTSKPFRYSARTWELNRSKSVSPHDSLGSNLVVQVKLDTVKRVVPLENEDVNECWLSDRDRFSYQGLNSDDRLTRPMIKDTAGWREADWQEALEHVAKRLSEVQVAGGADALGALVNPQSTLEEMHLAQKLMRGLGSDSIDFRLRQSDFSADGKRKGAPWLGMKVSEIGSLDRVLIVGSFLRKDHPLLVTRFRIAAKRFQDINILHCADEDLLMKVANKAIVAPQLLPEAMGKVVKAVAEAKQVSVPNEVAGLQVDDAARAIAASLTSGKNSGIFLGNLAEQHPRAAELTALAQMLAEMLGGRFGFLGQAANSVGGYLANCLPAAKGLNASAMLASPRKAYVLVGLEPELDCHNPAQAASAMAAADFVVALTSYRGRIADYADVMLPLAPFSEISGTFVNCEGRAQSFNAVAKPVGEARAGWKIFRVLGNILGLAGFEQDCSEAVRAEALGESGDPASKLDNRTEGIKLSLDKPARGGIQRLADVPIYFSDPIVRRATALQQTPDAQPPKAQMNAAMAGQFGLAEGDRIKLTQDGEATLEVALVEGLPAGVVRVAAAHPSTAALGAMFGEIALEKI